jgi:hypothetical protein
MQQTERLIGKAGLADQSHSLNRSAAAAQHIEGDDNHREHQQRMNQPATDAADEAQRPQHDEYDYDCP